MASSLAVAGVTLAAMAAAQPANAAPAGTRASTPATTANAAKPTVAYAHLDLPNGEWARVYSDGMAEVYKDQGHQEQAEILHIPLTSPDGGNIVPQGNGTRDLPSKGELITDLLHGQPAAYAPNQVVVVYKSPVTPAASVSASAKSLAASVPSYTSSAAANKVLDKLGVDQSRLMFANAAQRGKLAGMQAAAQRKTGKSLLDFSAATVLHVTGASVPKAVATLMASPDVAYAEPDWSVTTDNAAPIAVPAATLKATAQKAAAPADATASSLPDNYALTSSAQSLLNSPGVNALPAFADLAKYGQLPGQGEIITNVSLGDLDDASATSTPGDACRGYVAAYGPTTKVINGQRYIDWPSMPLIPTYTASSTGTLNPTGETCGSDPSLAEVGLDFSMMAPLPHDQQRAGAIGSGYTDLLGIAPGASYRLVVPATAGGAISNVDAAFVAAASQTPRPDVITSSIGFGTDQEGFSSRYLEDDPLTESIIASIVSSGIVVTVSAGDGLRTYTNAAVAPSGGAVATDVAGSAADVTNINDVYLSSAPSQDLDSGAIDVGGSTLDDVSIAPPDNPANKTKSWIQAYPATRYDAERNYASGYGTRVNVSAPGDDVLSFSHPMGASASAVNVGLEGGTSAAAPETAAAAAIALQVARLTGNTSLQGNPLAVRSLLESTGTPLGAVRQSDTTLNAGPQVNVGRMVETLLAQAHKSASPGVARVAIVQRQETSPLDEAFLTATDPGAISLTGQLSQAPITIAPDWTGLPDEPWVTYRLAGPHGGPLAPTPSARLTPAQILDSARLPLKSATSRSVTLTYSASERGQVVASATFTLTFGPWDGTTPVAPAPVAPPVVTGPTIPVSYDLTGLANATSPTMVISHPGRVDPATGLYFAPAYSTPLTAAKGTVLVPVSKLQGGGIYGIGIQDGPGGASATDLSSFTVIRVSPTGAAKPQVPVLSGGGVTSGHLVVLPYNGSFQLTYDARSVTGATGAVAEVSAPGPNSFGDYATFNNPNGSERDANGRDSGSVAWIPLTGTRGTATISAAQAGLAASQEQQVRIFATAPGGQVIGEASGVATISENGIATADGGLLLGGFGVSQDGNDGILTSQEGSELGSLETFNQSTGATSIVHGGNSAVYVTGLGSCPGMIAGDVAVYQNEFGNLAEIDTLSSVTSGTQGPSVRLPDTVSQAVLCVAGNQDTTDNAILGTFSDLTVTPANLAAGTIGTPVDIESTISSYPNGATVGGFAQDTATDTAVTEVYPYGVAGQGLLVYVNLKTGQVTTAPGAGPASGIAIDQRNGDILSATNGGVSIYDPSAGTQTPVSLGGATYEFPVSIPGTDDFLVANAYSPDALAAVPNNNALGSIVEVDDHGNVVHRWEEFNFFNSFFNTMGSYVQLNTKTHTAFTTGAGETQLQSFSYAGS